MGKGFVVEPDEAKAWIEADPRNTEVLFPYLIGEDVNSRADCFGAPMDHRLQRQARTEAKSYLLPYERVRDRVRPERLKKNRKGHRDYWWQYGEKATGNAEGNR